MSNWSVVSVSFSGLEHTPIQTVRDALKEHEPWIVVPSCDDPESPGSAVEWWMTTHINHLDTDELILELRKLSWQLPWEVCLIWKNEQMSVPRVEMVFPELIDEVENPEQVNLGQFKRWTEFG